MQNKEIEEAKNYFKKRIDICLENAEICDENNFDEEATCLRKEQILTENILHYIDKLETDKKKLIEKLEKKIRYFEEYDELIATSNDNYSDGTVIKRFIDEFREILSILKGENHE